MPRTFKQILAGFAVLVPDDFYNEPEGLTKLYELTDDLMALPESKQHQAIPAMFDVIERMADTEMGAPGPLVHALEEMRGHHEPELERSIRRQPAILNIRMVHRILNGIWFGKHDPTEHVKHMDLLRLAAEHPKAQEAARCNAQHYIELHTGREREAEDAGR